MTEMAPSNRQTANVSVSYHNLQPPAPHQKPLLNMMASARYRLPPMPRTTPAAAAAWSKKTPPCPSAPTSVRLQGDLAGGSEGKKLKPRCSYGCVIGLALRTSPTNSLPVSELYSAIQNIFPYFKVSPPNGWKNSVRHCLSLGKYFRKVESVAGGGCQMKKGFQWEVVPEKRLALDKEIESFLREESLRVSQSTVHQPPTLVPGDTIHGPPQLASQQRNCYGNVQQVYAQIIPKTGPPANQVLNMNSFPQQSNSETKLHPQQQTLQSDIKLPYLSISPATPIVNTHSDFILDRQLVPQAFEQVNPACEVLSDRISLDCKMVELSPPAMEPLTSSSSHLPGEIVETTLSTVDTHSVQNDTATQPLPNDHDDVQGDAIDNWLPDFDRKTLDTILSLAISDCYSSDMLLVPDKASTEKESKRKGPCPGKHPRLDEDECVPCLTPTPSKVIKVNSADADSHCNTIGLTTTKEGDNFAFPSLLHGNGILDRQAVPQTTVEVIASVMDPLTSSSQFPGEIMEVTPSTVDTHSVQNDPTLQPLPSDHVQGDAIDDCLLDFDQETLDSILSLLDSCDFPDELLIPEIESATIEKEPEGKGPSPGKRPRLDEDSCDLSLTPTPSKVIKVDSADAGTFCNTTAFTASALPTVTAEYEISATSIPDCTGKGDNFSSIDDLIEKTCLSAAIHSDQLPDKRRKHQRSDDYNFCDEIHSPTFSKVIKLDSYFHDLLFNTVVYSDHTPHLPEYSQYYSGRQTEGYTNIDTLLSMIECTGLNPTTAEPSIPIPKKPNSMIIDSLESRDTHSTLLESGSISTSSSCRSPQEERPTQRDVCEGTFMNLEESTDQ